MVANTDELDEELDDPISLMDFEDIKTEICDKALDQIPSAIIDLDESTDDESFYTSSYGKKDFVLPVTFFDISRNVKLLNKCKPMSIKVVDCKKHPTYYRNTIESKDVNESDIFVEEDIKNTTDSANKSHNPNDTTISSVEVVNKHNNERKHGHAFYEKLKKRKERKKEMALKSINLSEIDFKRNKGLVGLKITGNIFKQILETEKAFLKTKRHSGEINAKEKSEIHTTNTNSAGDKSDKTTKCAVDNSLSKTKSKSFDHKPKEKNRSDTVSFIADKTKEKRESNSQIVLVRTKINTVADESKEKCKNDTRNVLDQIKIHSAKNIPKKICETETSLVRSKSITDEDKPKKKCEHEYMSQINAVLDCLGTSVIPIQNMNVPKNVNFNDDADSKAHAGLPHIKDKQENSCKKYRWQLPSGKVIQKGLKHKKSKCDGRTSKNTTPHKTAKPKPKEMTSKDDKKLPKLSLKRSPEDADNFYVALDANVQCKNAKNTDVGQSSSEAKQVYEAINKDINISKKLDGSNSPVIPCTTLNASRSSIPPNVSAKDSSKPIQITTKTRTIVDYKVSKKDPLFTCLTGITSNSPAENPVNVVKHLSSQKMTNTNPTKCATELKSQMKPPPAENTSLAIDPTINGLNKNQANSNLSNNLPVSIRPRYYGSNAIINRKPPISVQLQTNMFLPQGRHIQMVINNRPQYQSMPMAVRSQVAPRYPPPNSSNINYAQPKPNQNHFHHLMPSASTIRGIGMNHYGPQSPGYPCPTRYRFPPPPPPPPPGPPPQANPTPKNNPCPPTRTTAIMNVSKDSVIGSTETGEPIKKISIGRPANTVTDKDIMLAELNNAIMSPELTGNNSNDKINNDLKRNVDPRSSKPCPLSKKNNNVNLNPVTIPDKSSPKVGYSPPILPILTYKETFEILSQNGKHVQKSGPTSDDCNYTLKLNAQYPGLNMRILGNRVQKRKIPLEESGQDKAKKISFEDYKKRVNKPDRIDVNKIRKYNEYNSPADDYNLDQGYDSDSTVKL